MKLIVICSAAILGASAGPTPLTPQHVAYVVAVPIGGGGSDDVRIFDCDRGRIRLDGTWRVERTKDGLMLVPVAK